MQVTIRIFQKNSSFGLPGQKPYHLKAETKFETAETIGDMMAGLLGAVASGNYMVEHSTYWEPAQEEITLVFASSHPDRMYQRLTEHFQKLPAAWSPSSYRGVGKWLDGFIKIFDQEKKV